MSTYHLVRYRFPHTNIIVFLSSYWVTAAFMLAVSIIFISKADWTTMPHIFK
jgi:hypothetical protein